MVNDCGAGVTKMQQLADADSIGSAYFYFFLKSNIADFQDRLSKRFVPFAHQDRVFTELVRCPLNTATLIRCSIGLLTYAVVV
jgi:hypothetical protein